MLKKLGFSALLVGVLMLTFAALTYAEFHSVATSPQAPSPEDMRLTSLICPELVDPNHAATKPHILVGIAFSRIYLLGGIGVLFAMLGIFLVLVGRPRKDTPKS